MTDVELMRLVEKDRAARGLTQAAYARYLGINKSTYTRLLAGERGLSNEFLDKLAKKVPSLWPDIEALIRARADALASTISTGMTLRGARNGLNAVGEGKTSERG